VLSLIRRITVALLLVTWLVPGANPAQARAAERPSTSASSPPAAAPRPAPGTASDVDRFAARERGAGDLESFEGGARIGTTTIIVILLLVIIIILLL
jgi:hypothetical protein